MKIPIALKLRTRARKELAEAQDMIVKEIFNTYDNAIFHGGTAIWRCYSGNRFSEDIDVYLPKDAKKLDQVFENLQKQGFKIEKKKVTDNSLFSNLKSNNVNVRFEAIFKMSSGELKDYEKIDGNFITVRCLEAEELVKEIKPYFEFVKRYTPQSTRQGSKEIFIVALGFKTTSSPKLFSSKE